MKLAQIGEFQLIERIRTAFKQDSPGVLGIGDDCAVWPGEAGNVFLGTTDLLVEHIHFLRDRITPKELGYKALAVNLSDIAAMGGTPVGAFLSIGLPGDLDVGWWDAFFEGVRELSESSTCPLLGGDTTKSQRDIVINVTVTGTMPAKHVKYRSAAKPGDVIAVTGLLGDVAGGLQVLLKEWPPSHPDYEYLVRAHHRPRPHLEEGAWLSKESAVHAMMDVSDGVDSDLRHIMKASRVGASVDVDSLPRSVELERVCQELNWNSAQIAVAGGEDYVLLCTIDPASFPSLAEKFHSTFKRPLHRIGVVTADTNKLVYQSDGETISFGSGGFDHFKQS